MQSDDAVFSAALAPQRYGWTADTVAVRHGAAGLPICQPQNPSVRDETTRPADSAIGRSTQAASDPPPFERGRGVLPPASGSGLYESVLGQTGAEGTSGRYINLENSGSLIRSVLWIDSMRSICRDAWEAHMEEWRHRCNMMPVFCRIARHPYSLPWPLQDRQNEFATGDLKSQASSLTRQHFKRW